MATLTIHNVPEDLLEKLEQSARENGRSLSNEVVAQLRQIEVATSQRKSADETIAELREFRKGLDERIWLTDEILNRAKREGRP